MRVWITKYALTQGLFEIEAELVRNGKYASGYLDNSKIKIFTADFARSKDEAIKIAETMKQNRIVSLKRSLKKLEGMKFA